MTGSFFVGVEFGANHVRGALLTDGETGARLAATAESIIIAPVGPSPHGPFDPALVGPAIDEVIEQLGVAELDGPVSIALSFGPPNSGVGSGPALPGWLQQQAELLGEPIVCAGDMGIAFAPRSAVDSVVSAAKASHLEPQRLDLAPMAAARVLDMHEVDTIVVGSGRGWQARLREAEVLEALEMVTVDEDGPLCVVDTDYFREPVTTYYDVGITAELAITDPDLSQLAAAVGAALGAFFDSPANMLNGWEVDAEAARHPHGGGLATPWGQTVAEPEFHSTTLNLQRLQSEAPTVAGADTVGTGPAADSHTARTKPADDAPIGPGPLEDLIVTGGETVTIDASTLDRPQPVALEVSPEEVAPLADAPSTGDGGAHLRGFAPPPQSIPDLDDFDLPPVVPLNQPPVDDRPEDDPSTADSLISADELPGREIIGGSALPLDDAPPPSGSHGFDSAVGGAAFDSPAFDSPAFDHAAFDGPAFDGEAFESSDPIRNFSPDAIQQQALAQDDGIRWRQVLFIVLSAIVIALLIYIFAIQ